MPRHGHRDVSGGTAVTDSYDSVSEYALDLIRRDKTRSERGAFLRLKAELARAYTAPENT
ncbi:MAG: hypothetical protein OXI83_05795 [Gemmatimonadota bacterium]|nr:hypothetical protein [Gemmatimonadota bacterium]